MDRKLMFLKEPSFGQAMFKNAPFELIETGYVHLWQEGSEIYIEACGENDVLLNKYKIFYKFKKFPAFRSKDFAVFVGASQEQSVHFSIEKKSENKFLLVKII